MALKEIDQKEEEPKGMTRIEELVSELMADDEPNDNDDDDPEDPDDSDDLDDDEDIDDAIAAGRTPKPTKETASPQDVNQILNDLRGMIGSGNKKEEKKISKLDAQLGALLERGAKKDEVGNLYAILDAFKQDILEEYKGDQEKMTQAQLEKEAQRALDREIANATEDNQAASWAAPTIRDRAAQLILQGRGNTWVRARQYFQRGEVPPSNYFKKAVERTLQTWEKQTGNNKTSKAKLDISNSPVKGSSKPKLTPKGQLDTRKFSDAELEIYEQTKNITKDDELALEAVKQFRSGSR